MRACRATHRTLVRTGDSECLSTFRATDFNLGWKGFGRLIDHFSLVVLNLSSRGIHRWSCTRFNGKLVAAIGATYGTCVRDWYTKASVALRT